MRRIILFILCIILFSCSKVEDNPQHFSKEQKEAALEKAKTADDYFLVKDFIWKGLNQYYLWQGEVPALSDTRFEKSIANTDATSENYVKYLKGFRSPRELFNSLLYNRQGIYGDRFSYITDNYEKLEESLQGSILSTGIDYSIAWTSNGHIIGYVRYVIPNSDAERKGVKRGDIFAKIDGQELTYSNYHSLLNNQNSSLTFSFYTINNKTLTFKENKTILQTTMREDPILLHKVIPIEGKKVAYLVYNGFVSKYDLELNNVFGTFKAEGATELILDLRYNPGGSVQTAIYLASMIAGADTQKIFIKQTANAKMSRIWKSYYYFENNILGTPINNLNLSRVYILTSHHTASASELIINGLKPYMEVIQIGETTVGKNLASITIKDREHPENKWAMQPIVMRSENASGFGAYEKGLSPTIELSENPLDLVPLGNPNETLLAKALEQITGRQTFYASARSFQSRTNTSGIYILKELDNSKSYSPYYHRMFVDNPFTE